MEHFPYYKQAHDKDCGITCLQMIAKYHGRNLYNKGKHIFVPPHGKGVSLFQLKTIAKQTGFQLGASYVSIDSLAGVELPVILHWNTNHFIVLYKINRNGYHIADPARGMMVLAFTDFLSHWKNNKCIQTNCGIVVFVTCDKF